MQLLPARTLETVTATCIHKLFLRLELLILHTCPAGNVSLAQQTCANAADTSLVISRRHTNPEGLRGSESTECVSDIG